MMEPHEAERPDCDERSRHDDEGDATHGALNAIDTQMCATWHDTGLKDILTAEQGAGNTRVEPDLSVSGDRESGFAGHDMHVKLDSAGCRVITMNTAKKLLETIDEITDAAEPKNNRTIRYINYVTEYINELQGDITIINEPGAVHGAAHIIHAAAEQAGMEAVVAGTEHSIAAGLVVKKRCCDSYQLCDLYI